MAKVELQDISRQFDRAIAVENISFTVPDGEFWVLVGPSGCGKSTILRTIAGLETATSGHLYIGETLMNGVPARQRDVAMVFQNYALYPHMTVFENLAFGLKMRQVEDSAIAQKVEKAARSLAIEHLLQRKPKQLSGGQQQRVALGRAIVREPQVFLLDEPLSNLDAQLRDETRAELKQLHTRLGITTIYVTHDCVEAMTLADRIVVLNRGRIQQIGSPHAIYNRPKNLMVATFLGNPPMNILRAIYIDGTFEIHDQTLPCPLTLRERLQPKNGQGFDLGIRPEHIRINPSTEQSHLSVKLNILEPLGRETLIRATLPQSDILLNFYSEGNWQGSPGDTLSIHLDLDHLLVFDPGSGKTIYITSNFPD
ncbi:ABC transporter ATP-binding protein [Lusitaniella coriacea]|uniref:ABC transporter ATP-binding protein n=1 Tax=Lusitaniella coriacea TaxID=1983105 RepID=UPI003CF133A2